MNIKTEINGAAGIATLNRPDALNALNTELLNELADALESWDQDDKVRCMIVTGSERAFAAGVVLRICAIRRHPLRHRQPSERTVSSLHRREGRDGEFQRRRQLQRRG